MTTRLAMVLFAIAGLFSVGVLTGIALTFFAVDYPFLFVLPLLCLIGFLVAAAFDSVRMPRCRARG